MVERARWRRWTLLTAAVSVSLALAACVPPPFTSSPSALSEESVDTALVTESLKLIDGVEDAEVRSGTLVLTEEELAAMFGAVE